MGAGSSKSKSKHSAFGPYQSAPRLCSKSAPAPVWRNTRTLDPQPYLLCPPLVSLSAPPSPFAASAAAAPCPKPPRNTAELYAAGAPPCPSMPGAALAKGVQLSFAQRSHSSGGCGGCPSKGQPADQRPQAEGREGAVHEDANADGFRLLAARSPAAAAPAPRPAAAAAPWTPQPWLPRSGDGCWLQQPCPAREDPGQEELQVQRSACCAAAAEEEPLG
jgi:hypothetical protein